MKNGRSLLSLGNDRAGAHHISLFYSEMYLPFFFCVKGVHVHAAGNIFSGGFGDLFQRTLDTVENIVDDTRSQENGDRVACSRHSFSGTQPCGLLENLNGGHAFFKTDDLAYQAFLSHIYHLGNLESRVALQINNGAVDAVNNTCSTHASDLRQI